MPGAMRVSRVLFCTLSLVLAAWLNIPALVLASPPAPAAVAPVLLPPQTPPGEPKDAQSTTGPLPPPWVQGPDASAQGLHASSAAVVISGVPAYLWRHGCGPTAAGMVLGYWDRFGYDDLVPGTAFTQTASVAQMIASDGPSSHYTDYCEPLDGGAPTILPDKSEDPPGDEHPDNCVADYMRTSQSRYGNRYGWSWFSDIKRAYQGYVASASGGRYVATITNLWMSAAPQLTWDVFRAEIDAGRPMVLLVDTDGNDATDHFVTAIGYDQQDGVRRYACLDTWDTSVRWADFTPMGAGHPWGIYGATLLDLAVPPASVALQGPAMARLGAPCAFTAAVTPTMVSQPLTYVWQATEHGSISHTLHSTSDTVSFTWITVGRKTVTVQVSNDSGTTVHNSAITVVPLLIYMPLQRSP